MKKRILFVDDEVNVLNGLRRSLHPLQAEWDMLFVDTALAALNMMATQRVDVLVTDMRMPGMDGLQLLREVRDRYPNVARFVLSGYSDQETMVQGLGLAHQFLAKPCAPDMLRHAIHHTYSLRGFMVNPALQQVVSRIGVLPALPSVHMELLQLLGDPEITPARIGTLIAQDVGLTAKVLQVINSAFFSLRKRITDPREAVIFLGLDVVRALINMVAVFTVLDNEETEQFIHALYAHTVRVGRRARLIARQMDDDPSISQQAMLAGMLHDLGKLVLSTYLRQSFFEALSWATQQNLFVYQAEREIIGVTHAEIGAYLLGLWGFDEDLVQIVAYHHEPTQTSTFDARLAAVHIANAFDHIDAVSDGVFTKRLDLPYLGEAGITIEQIVEWYVASDLT